MRIWRSMSIHAKLFFLIWVFILMPCLILGALWYQTSTRAIRDNVVGFSSQIVDQMNVQLDDYFTELNTVTAPIVTSPEVLDFLNIEPEDIYKTFMYTNQIRLGVFHNLLSLRTDIYNISLVSSLGQAVSSLQNGSSMEAFNAYSRSGNNGNVFMVRGARILSNTKTPVITVTRDLYDPKSDQIKGMLIIDLNYNRIRQILSHSKLGKSDVTLIRDAEDHIVYDPDESKWGLPAGGLFPADSNGGANGYQIHKINGKQMMLIYSRLTSLNWESVDEVPLNELFGRLSKLRYTTMAVGLLMLVFIVFILGSFTLSLTRPMLKLQQLMKRAEIGDLNVRAPGHLVKEIGGLFRSFNRMVGEIKQLIEVVHLSRLKQQELEIREMEATLMMLQSQINPHFLYNTLDVVNSLAIDSGVDSVSKMIKVISNMFRYNTSGFRQKVSLYDEIVHNKTYLYIQQERFGGLDIVWELCEADLLRVPCLRMILQPIVENAFSHGYEAHRIKPAYLGFFGRNEPQAYVLTIRDKGQGMEPDTMERLNRMFTTFGAAEIIDPPNQDRKHIGLRNVHSRLRLEFGEPFGLRIQSSDITGTAIEIKLPWGNEHDQSDGG